VYSKCHCHGLLAGQLNNVRRMEVESWTGVGGLPLAGAFPPATKRPAQYARSPRTFVYQRVLVHRARECVCIYALISLANSPFSAPCPGHINKVKPAHRVVTFIFTPILMTFPGTNGNEGVQGKSTMACPGPS